MTIFLTVFSGVLVFVLGQIILKLFIEPWQEQRECIAKIAYNILYHNQVFSNPGDVKEELMTSASDDTRRLASDIIKTIHKIPFYTIVSKLPLFPTVEEIFEVQKHLIGLSNSTHRGDPEHNDKRIEKIRKILRIYIADI